MVGLPCDSDQYAVVMPTRKRIPIAEKIAQPWRSSRTIRPNTLVRAAPIANIESNWTRLVRAFGFSYGCAELALRNPPPFVPRILIASCDATGPWAIVCL